MRETAEQERKERAAMSSQLDGLAALDQFQFFRQMKLADYLFYFSASLGSGVFIPMYFSCYVLYPPLLSRFDIVFVECMFEVAVNKHSIKLKCFGLIVNVAIGI